MKSWEWAVALRPLGALLIMLCVVAPIRWAIMRKIPEGKLRRLLLTRLN